MKKGKFGRKTPVPTGQPGVIRVRRPYQARGEMYGVITRILGGNHLEVMYADEKLRITRIPGKFRRRRWLRAGDLVIVEPWYGLNEDKKGDLIYRYHPNQVRILQERGMLGAIEEFLEFGE
jgi:translation initiation factor 1A